MATSAPPPRVRPNGAATTGIGLYRMRWFAAWKPATIFSTEPRSSLLMAMSRAMMLAPGGEVAPVVADDQAAGEASARSSAVFIISMMPSSMEFILVWNSSRSAPSPMSQSVALSFPSSALVRPAEVLDAQGRADSPAPPPASSTGMSQAVSVVPSTA